MKQKIKKKGIKKRLFSVVLALAMVITLMPNLSQEVLANEYNGTEHSGMYLMYNSNPGYIYWYLVSNPVIVIEKNDVLTNVAAWPGDDKIYVDGERLSEGDSVTGKVVKMNGAAIYICSDNDHDSQKKENDLCETCQPVCGHEWEYSLANNNTTIKATCNGDDHEGDPVTLTLTASNTNYSGSAYTGASLGGTTAWVGAGLTVPTIKYFGRANTTYAENETAPTDIGTYTAKITVEEQTAEKEFAIKGTATAEDFEFSSATYEVTAEEGKDVGTITTYYKVNGAWTTSKPTVAGFYDMGIVTAGSDIYNAAGTASEPLTTVDWKYVVAPTNWPTSVHSCTRGSEDHFYATGDTYTKAGLENAAVVGIWFEVGKQWTSYVVGGENDFGINNFDGNSVTAGWYYLDRAAGKYIVCQNVNPAPYYPSTPSTPAKDPVVEKIEAIGTVDLSTASKEKIEEARKAYDALTDAQKAAFPAETLKMLEEAEAKYAELEKAEEGTATQPGTDVTPDVPTEPQKTTSSNVSQSTKPTVKVPSTVEINGETYVVTVVPKNAFNDGKVKNVSLPSTIEVIKKKAFAGDSKLNKIMITSKEIKVEKGAFNGMAKAAKAKVKVFVSKNMSKKNFKALQAILVKEGLLKKNIVRQ